MNFSHSKRIIVIVSFIWFVLVSVVSHADTTENFITLADIHFSPFINCDKSRPCAVINKLDKAPASQWGVILGTGHTRLSSYHQNTNYPLLVSALGAVGRTVVNKNAKFIIVLGDTLAHDYRRLYRYYTGKKDAASYQAFVHKTYQFINAELLHAFSDINVYMVVGNNDSYSGDYATRVRGAFFQDEGRLWSTLIKNPAEQRAMQQSFSNAGYYAVNVPGSHGVRLIVLNTNLFSMKARGSDLKSAAAAQLAWLRSQLAEVKKSGETAWIAMHIPEGIDVFSTLRIRGIPLIQFWRTEDANEFQKVMRQFAPQVTAVFAAHLHSDWVQMLQYDNSIEIPVTGTPSISPVYGNNPGYKLYTYSLASKKTVDHVTYYLPLSGQTNSQTNSQTIVTQNGTLH